MSLADYQLTCRDPVTGGVKTVLDGTSFDDLKYSRELNEVGALAATFPMRDEWLNIFTLDTLIDIERTSPVTGALQTEDTFLCRLTHHFREGDEEKYVVGGLSLNHLLARRLIDPTDDPAAAAGYSLKSGPADDIMVSYANQQCGLLASAARAFPNFSVAPSASIGVAAGRRLRYDNLLKILQDIGNQAKMDFTTVRLTGNTLRLIISPIGTDKTRGRNYPFAPFVELNPLRGNLSDPSLLFDRKGEQNYVYALAQGPGDRRIVTKVSGDGTGDSPYNRIEFTTDIRNAERGDTTNVRTGAFAALYDKAAKKEFTFKPTGTQPGATYRNDWDIGDTVTCTFANDSFDLRIRAVEITLSHDSEEIAVTVLPV